MRCWKGLLLIILFSTCINAIPQVISHSAEARSTTKDAPMDFEKLVESLHSRNHPPEIRRSQRVLFGPDYDFREQRRIRKAVLVLQVCAEDAWPHLVSHIEDPAYSCTVEISDEIHNYTVGSICEQIIRNSLYAFHDSCGDLLEGTDLSLIDIRDAGLADVAQLRSWLIDRKDKSVLELQEELNESLKQRLATLRVPGEIRTLLGQQVDEHRKRWRTRGYSNPQVSAPLVPGHENMWFQSRPDAK